MKSEYKYRVIQLSFLLFLLVLIFFLYALYTKKEAKENSELIRNYINEELTLKEETINEELKTLIKWFETKNVTDYDKGLLCERISNIYSLQNDTLKYYKYLGYSLYYLDKVEDYETAGSVYADLAKFFINNGAYDEAQKLMNKIYELKPLDDFENLQYKSYFYRQQGIIDIARGKNSEALDNLYSSREVLDNAEGEKYQEAYYAMTDMAIASAYFNQGKYGQTEIILKQYAFSDLFTQKDFAQNISEDFIIPYYEISSKLAIQKRDYTLLEESLNNFLLYCEKYNYQVKELNDLVYMLNNLEGSNETFIQKLYMEISNTYAKISETQSKDFGNLVINQMEYSINEIRLSENTENNRTQNHISFILILIVLLIAAYALIVIIRQGEKDALTSVYNKKALLKRLNKLKNNEQLFSVIIIDIDDFKKVNDTYGHETGDYVLKTLGKILLNFESRVLKAYRYGGEEFVLIMLENQKEWVLDVSESIRLAVEYYKWEKNLKITVSVGVSLANESGSLIDNADDNLYFSKRNGKNVISYSEDGTKKIYRRGDYL